MSQQDFPEDLWSLAFQNEQENHQADQGEAFSGPSEPQENTAHSYAANALPISSQAAPANAHSPAKIASAAPAEPNLADLVGFASTSQPAARAVSGENIVQIDVCEEMKGSFLEYAYSVIYSRALPDARDGLKPVQRRILYMMHDMGLVPTRGHVKSSRVVGEVMGKLHPHGDSAIYEALVRLAQPFNLRLPQIDGHGNFGSLDDGPAAPRYTEARLAPAALDMVAHLDEEVVDFVPNYDNQFLQPCVLPAAYPNLLVNGAAGIAVGMATNIAPHNLAETIAGAVHLLRHPEASVADLMQFIPGPDFPAGGIVTEMDGVRDAYETGKGVFKVRALASIERVTARKMGLVITQLPYMVGPERVIEKIKEAVNRGRIKGISAVTNLTDRDHDLKLVIEIKNGFSPEAVLAALYRLTPLEETFNTTAIALVDGQPRTLNLKEILQVFCAHRMQIVLRRSQHRLARALKRLHLVEGLLVAVLDIDEVITIVRAAESVAEAKSRLMVAFDLSETQTEHILSLQLRRLTKFSLLELQSEKEELESQVSYLRELLDSEEKRRELVIEELQEVARRHATPRRTLLLSQDVSAQKQTQLSPAACLATSPARKTADLKALEIADEPTLVLLSQSGKIARASEEKINSLLSSLTAVHSDCEPTVLSPQGSRDKEAPADYTASGAHFAAPDATDTETHPHSPAPAESDLTLGFLRLNAQGSATPLASCCRTTTRSQLGALTNLGRVHKFNVLELPELVPNASGVQLQGTISLSELISLEKNERVLAILSLDANSAPWWMATTSGQVKRCRVEVPPTLDVFEAITLAPREELVCGGHCPDSAFLFLATDDAQLLRFNAQSVRPQGRLGKGMAGIKLKAGARVIAGQAVAAAHLDHYFLLAIAQNTQVIPTTVRLSPLNIYPEKGRAGQGVRCQRFLKGEVSLQAARFTPAPLLVNAQHAPLPLPAPDSRRDGSGNPLPGPVAYLA